MPDNDCRATDSTVGAILVWDAEGVPEADFELTVLWRGFEESPRQGARMVSIARLVEDSADELRSRYLAWLHALGEATVDGQTVAQHMLIRPGLSYWWMASPAQKFSISATSLVPDAVKLLALEKLLASEQGPGVVLHSSNARLAESLASYCGEMGRRFDWRRHESSGAVPRSRRATYGRLPPPVRAVISFVRYCVSRLPAVFRRSDGRAVGGSISFFDVLVHLDKRGLDSGRFVSNYWGPLVYQLSRSGVRTNWFHFFHPHPAVPNFASALRLVRRFQRSAAGGQRHGLIDVFPPLKTAVRAWRDYRHLQRAVRAIDGFHADVRPEGSALTLWPLHQDEWAESVSGPNALMECLRLGLYEVALAGIPRQQVGVYICENQPWEMSLIYAWRDRGHGRLVAAPHSTIRYWDLRYFYDQRSYAARQPGDLPMPDQYAVNGPVAKAAALAGGYPTDKVVDVEALRFMHLGRSSARRLPGHTATGILICGDFLSTTNDRIFDWLQRAEADLPAGARVVFKPHPAFPYEPAPEFSARIGLRIDERPLENLLPECDIVITSAITSAAVDAYCAGKQVIQIPDGRGLNANALRGLAGTWLVAGPSELAAALQEAPACEAVTAAPYFCLDASLSAWLDVLGAGRGTPAFQSSSGSGGS
ncbi:MAG: hypothetical protein FHP92_20275 [Denitromonas halophila]|nr:MAG: hypothetical protein FHP92_20275 [Denitromonas halophila]